MKKIYFILPVLLASLSASAQSIRLTPGKKFNTTMVMQMTTNTSAMGQEMTVENTNTTFSDFEVKTVTNKGYILSGNVKRVKVAVTVMGQDQSFDSDDESTRSNPQLAEAFSSLNKPFDMEIENGKTVIKGGAADKLAQMMGGVASMINDNAKFILTQEDMLKLKEGHQWTDSAITDGNKVFNEYTAGKTDDTSVAVTVKTTSQLNVTQKQMGMEIKQSLHGTTNAKRQYNKATGLLTKEESDMELSGDMEVMGQTAPISMKGKITTTIN
jgi:hypothetical protein